MQNELPLPSIPEYITVHLGAPDDTSAQNVTVPFIDYIKNVASSEIYPTWPENALRANIYAEVSFALNRIYTEYYRSRGYDFDITNSTARDQSFVYGRDIFDNISTLVDDLFDDYLRRQGNVEPLFAQYCNGTTVTCDGLSQWGSVSLAEAGYTPYQIITDYYGNNVDIVTDAPIMPVEESVPTPPLRIGSSGNDVRTLQIRLNRVSTNFPNIPKIYPINGVFGGSTEEAVKEFQRQFNLTPDGIVGRATWYQLLRIYGGVKRLSELQSEGITPEEIALQYPAYEIAAGAGREYVLIVQYYLNVIAENSSIVPSVAIDGIYGDDTAYAVRVFQENYGLEPTGRVNEATWNALTDIYNGIVESLPDYYSDTDILPFPGRVLSLGVEGNDVRILQEYLNELAAVYPEIPTVEVTGVFSPETETAVRAFEELNGLEPRGVVGVVAWYELSRAVRDLRSGELRSTGQYPGYDIGDREG